MLRLIGQKASVSLQSLHFTHNKIHYLKLNNKFALPIKPSFLIKVAPIERAFKFNTLNTSQKDSIRYPIAENVNFNNDLPKSNMRKGASNCLENLKSYIDIFISKAFKSSHIVVTDKSKYRTKIWGLIDVSVIKRSNLIPLKEDLKTIKSTFERSLLIISNNADFIIILSLLHMTRFYTFTDP